MKTLHDLLRDADPLAHEPLPSPHELRARRRAIVAAPRSAPSNFRRTAAALACIVLLGAAAAIGLRAPRAAIDVIAAVRFEVRLAETSPGPGLREAVPAGGDRRIYLHQDSVVVTNADIAQAQVVPGAAPTAFGVAVTFTADGAARMRKATERHIGRPVAILIDGEVVAAPTVRSAIGTSAVISGSFTRAEADRIVAGIVGR